MVESGISGSVAVVTGGASGIGHAVVADLTARGARVASLDTDTDRLTATVRDLRTAGHDVVPLTADIGDSDAVEHAFDRAEAELGPVTAVVSAAGALTTGPVVECSDRDWARMLDVNATGVFHLGRAAARRMGPRGSGSLVTVASNAAGVPRAGMAAYAAAKAAAVAFTKSLGLELAPDGVRCNVVCPGSTDTPMLRAMTGGTGTDPLVAGDPGRFRVGIPLGRIGRARDVADAVRFLLSDSSRHITMHELYVDGGASLR